MREERRNRTENSIINVIFGFLYQFVTLILSFASRTVFLHVLSVEYLGINGLFTDILQMLSLADLGFTTAMTYSFYKPLAENDTEKISKLIHFYKNVYSIIAATVGTIGILLTPFVKYIVNAEQEIPLLNVYYLFSLAGVVISYLFVYKTALLVADQKNYIVVKISIVINIIKTTIQIIALLLYGNYIVYLAVGLCANYANNFIASKKAEEEYPYLIKRTDGLDDFEKKNIFVNLKSVFLYKVSGLLLNATDNIFISVLVNTATVGYYSNYLMINGKVTGFLSTGFGAITASIGNVIVTEREEKRYSIFQALQTVSYMLCGVVVATYLLLINDFINIWLGKEYIFDLMTVVTIALNLYFACVLQPIWSYREATGLYRKTKFIMLITAALNVFFSLGFGMLWGTKGILFASILSRILTYIWYEPYLLFVEYFKKSVKEYYFGLMYNMALIILATFINVTIVKRIVVNGWFILIFKAIIVSGINIIIFMGAYYKTDGCKMIISKVKSLFQKWR